MNGNGRYFAEDVVPDCFPKITYWCGGCNAEPATTDIEVFFNDTWVPVKIGTDCLTKAQKEGTIEE